MVEGLQQAITLPMIVSILDAIKEPGSQVERLATIVCFMEIRQM